MDSTEYSNRLQKLLELAPRYTHLPLPELLMKVGTESGYSTEEVQKRLNNVYINEVIHAPEGAGYFEYDGEYWFWMTNERNQMFSKKFENVTEMVGSFFVSTGISAISPYDRGGFRISLQEFVEKKGMV